MTCTVTNTTDNNCYLFPFQMSLTLLDGLSNQTLDTVLEDLLARFLINVPSEDLASVERIFFQVEEAHWFYSDYVRVLNPSLPPMKIKPFACRLLALAPLIWRWGDPSEALARFGKYKSTIPVRGLALFSPDLSKVLLVKGTDSNSWSFPRGKISKGESDVDCAVREALEETGFNAAGFVNENDYIERTMLGKNYKIFLCKNVPLDYPFAPIARFEIVKIEWHDVKQLVKRAKASPNQYFIVSAMIKPILKWIDRQKGSEADLLQQAERRLKLLLGIVEPEASTYSNAEAVNQSDIPANAVNLNWDAAPPPNFPPDQAHPPQGAFHTGPPPPPSFFPNGIPPPPHFFLHEAPPSNRFPMNTAPHFDPAVVSQDPNYLLNAIHRDHQEAHPSPRPDQLQKPLAGTHDFLSILTSKDRVSQNATDREIREPHDSSLMDSLKQRAAESDLPAHFIKLLNKKKEKRDTTDIEKIHSQFSGQAIPPTSSQLASPSFPPNPHPVSPNVSQANAVPPQHVQIPRALGYTSPHANAPQLTRMMSAQGASQIASPTVSQLSAQAGSHRDTYTHTPQPYGLAHNQPRPSNEIEQSMLLNQKVIPDRKVVLLKRLASHVSSDQPQSVDKLASRSLLGLLGEQSAPIQQPIQRANVSHAHAQDLMSMLRKKESPPVPAPVQQMMPESPPSHAKRVPSVSSHMLPKFDNFETFEDFEEEEEEQGYNAPPAYRNFDVASDDEDVDHLVDGINNVGLAIPPTFHAQPERQRRPIRLLRHGETFPDATGSPGPTQATSVPVAHVPAQNSALKSAGQNLLAMLQRPPTNEVPHENSAPPATNTAGKDLMNVLFGRN